MGLIRAYSSIINQPQIISINPAYIGIPRFACKNEGKSPAETLKGFDR